MEKQSIRLVVADLDGTVLNSRKEITPEALRVVREMQDAGVMVVFCSGRAPYAMKEIVERFGLKAPTGALNGALMLDDEWRVMHKVSLPEERARKAMLLAFEQGIDIWLYTDFDWYVMDRYGPRVQHEVEITKGEPNVVRDFDEKFPETVKLLGVCDDAHRLVAFEEFLQQKLQNDVCAVRTQWYYLEITHPLANKAEFVRQLQRRYGIAKEETVAIGDMPADAVMFEHSGLGIAMGNSLDEVKELAGALTGTCDEDGFAHAMRAHVLSMI